MNHQLALLLKNTKNYITYHYLPFLTKYYHNYQIQSRAFWPDKHTFEHKSYLTQIGAPSILKASWKYMAITGFFAAYRANSTRFLFALEMC